MCFDFGSILKKRNTFFLLLLLPKLSASSWPYPSSLFHYISGSTCLNYCLYVLGFWKYLFLKTISEKIRLFIGLEFVQSLVFKCLLFWDIFNGFLAGLVSNRDLVFCGEFKVCIFKVFGIFPIFLKNKQKEKESWINFYFVCMS